MAAMARQLTSPHFIDPFLVRILPATGTVHGGTVCVDGRFTLEFCGPPYPEQTTVRVWLDRHFWCMSLDEIEQARQKGAGSAAAAKAASIEQARLAHNRAIAFNAALCVPVVWRPEVKRVLGGLTANSSGNGMVSRSVWHIYLLEELVDGRLIRPASSFLCSQPKGLHFSECLDNNLEGLAVAVSCARCLQVAKRWHPLPTIQ